MAYQISLTDEEVRALGWFTNRGYFPSEAFDAMTTEDETEYDLSVPDSETARSYSIPECAAWSILMLERDDPDAFLACMGGDLLGKVVALWQEIV